MNSTSKFFEFQNKKAQIAISRRQFLSVAVSAAVAGVALGSAGQKRSDQTSTSSISSRPASSRDQLVDLADPNIGGIGHLLTSLDPEVQLPHGMCLVTPVIAPGETDSFLASRVFGFSIGSTILMVSDRPAADGVNPSSEWDHDLDSVRPSDANYFLEDSEIRVRYSVTEHSACFRFETPAEKELFLFLRPVDEAEYELADPSTVIGTETKEGVESYFHLQLSQPVLLHDPFIPASSHLNSDLVNGFAARETPTSKGSGMQLKLPGGLACIEARIGISYIDANQANRNVTAENPDWSFEIIRGKARSAWNAALGKVTVRGGSTEQQTMFYTALYRSLQYMKNVTEQGRYFGPYDHQVHLAEGRRFYIEDNLWDTYRCKHPLQTILEPEVNQDQIQSFVRMYEESGWMPQFPFMSGDLPFMNGNHAASMVLDSYQKDQRNFDVEKAYSGLKKSSTEATMLPYRRGGLTKLDRFYAEHGYFPALRKGEKETVAQVDPDMRRQAVAVTLDAAYDDWCISELARELGKADDAAFFAGRALNYRNVFNSATGWMTPRTADGNFIGGFNPKWAGGQAGRDYFTECNGWVFNFDVQHDVAGLIALMGGCEKFVERLDQLFSEGYDGNLKFVFLSQFPDSTALIGQYPQGNEPSFHIPYLYNYAGVPWKTQRRVRQIMQVWYAARPLGLPGDDDSGAITSWYVFSAMGFYPVCPGRPFYALGSPIFDEVRIDVGEGKEFCVIANSNSVVNKYIQSATLNGRPFNRNWFEHSTLMAGGYLELRMGARPNKDWGANLAAAPPSLTTGN